MRDPRLYEDTIWLNLNQMAQLFRRDEHQKGEGRHG
jgi:hypothetical protein